MQRTTPKVVAALLVAGLTALSGTPAAATHTVLLPINQPKQILRLELGSRIDSLDSAVTTEPADLDVLQQVMEGLVRVDRDGQIKEGSGAAESWTVSPNGRTYTFKLREGLKWSDGVKLTAHDFAYSWLRAMGPRNLGAGYIFRTIEGADEWMRMDHDDPLVQKYYDFAKSAVGIKAVDDRTLTVTLAQPDPAFLRKLALPVAFPQRRDVVERAGGQYGMPIKGFVSNGPFVLAAAENAFYTLAPNKEYWDRENVKLSYVQMYTHRSGNLKSWSTGVFDLMEITGTDAETAQAYLGSHRTIVPVTAFLSFNGTSGPLSNVHIRRAISLAVDRPDFLKRIARSSYEPALGLIPPTLHVGDGRYGDHTAPALQAHSDPKGAAAELAAGLKELNLKELPPIKLLTSTEGYGIRLEAMLEQNLPGLDIEVNAVDFATRLSRMRKGEYELLFSAWRADYDDPLNMLLPFQTGSYENSGHFANPEFDRLMQKALAATDPAERLALVQQGERLLLDQAFAAPLYFQTRTILRQPYLSGVIDLEFGGRFDLKYAAFLADTVLTFKAGEKEATVNGDQAMLPVAPELVGEELLFPLTTLGQAWGASVTVQDGRIRYTRRSIDTLELSYLELEAGEVWGAVNDHLRRLPVAPKLVDGVPMVPLRFVAEALGRMLEYDAATGVYTLTRPR